MIRNITIQGKEIPMLATAATPYRYKHMFHEDLMKILLAKQGGEDSDVDTDFIGKLAYIMTMQAQGADMTKLNQETFFAWLDQFDPLSVTMAGEAIVDLYVAQSVQTSAPKKKDGEPTGK